MPLARATKIIAALLIGLFLSVPHAALAQEPTEAATLTQQIIQLYKQGRYSEAIPLAQRLLTISEPLGPDHPDVANSLNILGALYRFQGRYADAEPLFKRALSIREKTFGHDHPDVAQSLNNLASVYEAQGRYTDAEPLYKQSLAIREKALGPHHPDFATALNNLAGLYKIQGRFAEAAPLYKRALAINEKALGPDHPNVAGSQDNLATLYDDQGRYADAEPLYKRSLAIRERTLGPDHPDVAQSLNNLAVLYEKEGRYAEAEPFYKRALTTGEKALGPDHPHVALLLNNLAEFYRIQSRYGDAEPLYKRSLAISEKVLGPDHPDVAVTLNNLAVLYQSEEDAGGRVWRYADVELLFKRALSIREKALGPDHPDVAQSLNNLAVLYNLQGRYAEAEPLFKRALSIREKALGPDHPDVAGSLNNLAQLYGSQGRYAEAELLQKRSLAIKEKTLGPDHPDVALSLNNLADLYRAQTRYADALQIVQRTISQNTARKPLAFAILYGSQFKNLISPKQALDASFAVLQRSTSSAAGEAVSKLAARFAAGTDELSQFVREDQDLAAEADRLDKSIITAVSKPPVERNQAMEDQIRKRIGAIKSERNGLLEVFKQRFPDYIALSRPQPLTVEETQALLADDEAVVTIDLDQKSYVWVITKDRAEWKELSVSAEDVSKAVRILRTGLDTPKPFDSNLAYELYRKVLGPTEEIISNKTRLSFVLDGALTSLPAQVLITTDPDGKNLNSVDWLVRKYAVTVLPSIASLKILRDEKSTVAALKPMIGFGDPVFDRTVEAAGRQKMVGLNRSLTSFYRGVTADTRSLAEALPTLPETADELRAVAKILGATSEDIKLGEAASVTTVKKEPLADYRVVYFATHALVAGEVEKFAKVKAEPALVLSIPEKPTEDDDGLLRASDVWRCSK
jgi:tetratricopeptide (TPR) repeat protein